MKAIAVLQAVAAVALLAALAATTHSSARRSELVEASPQMQQELMGCAKLAKEFKGAKVLARKVTQAQKIEAMRCMQVIKMAHAERAHVVAARTSGLAQDTQEKCTCCAFAGCPCCQPAMRSGMEQLQYVQHGKGQAQSPYGELPPQSFPFPHASNGGANFEYGAKAPVSQLKMKKTQQLNYVQHGKGQAQSPYGELPPQSFPFPHASNGGANFEYGAKAPVSQLKMKKPFFHREGKFARKTQQLSAAKQPPKKMNPISWDLGYIAAHRKEHPLGFSF